MGARRSADSGPRGQRDRPWTAREVRALKDGWDGHGPYWDGWAELLPGRTCAAIGQMGRQLGLPRRRRGEPWDEEGDRVVLRHVADAARELGRTPSAVVTRAVALRSRAAAQMARQPVKKGEK